MDARREVVEFYGGKIGIELTENKDLRLVGLRRAVIMATAFIHI
jgi:hypothetical protein